tara:strand:- start:10198 stop:10356 length:159 start_codon:yes stop_codon:yes gene_type:complete
MVASSVSMKTISGSVAGEEVDCRTGAFAQAIGRVSCQPPKKIKISEAKTKIG